MMRAPHVRSTRFLLSISLLAALATALTAPTAALAQDWGDDDDWSSSDARTTSTSSVNDGTNSPTTPWSLRAGMGFTSDPNNFLLAFELDYRFDQYVSVGPLFQIGLEDNRSIVAPTMNLNITIPNLPGEFFERIKPNVFTGVGFAVIENEDKFGDDREAAFLVNAGFGLDYVLSERVSVGSRMILNFLPGRALGEEFFYTWEVASVKLSF